MAATEWTEYPLTFGFTARTSREVMQRRSTFLLRRPDASMPSGRRHAEANFFESLAPESRADFFAQLKAYCDGTLPYGSVTSSAVRCAADMLDMPLSDNSWTRGHSGIAINGLIWMADKNTMRQAIADKLQQGFKVLKLKIGGIDFDDELNLIRAVRRQFTPDERNTARRQRQLHTRKRVRTPGAPITVRHTLHRAAGTPGTVRTHGRTVPHIAY